jgi:hypothetical protein
LFPDIYFFHGGMKGYSLSQGWAELCCDRGARANEDQNCQELLVEIHVSLSLNVNL